jgi:formamidopyrimidine-DNA glycosylase
MTGKWVANPAPDRAHQHIQLFFDDGKQPACVALIDPRGFGHTEVINSAGLEHPRIQALGPEPSAPQFCGKYLLKRIGASRAPFKQRLMDQHVVAGLGNIAVFEIAWRVKLHPHTPCANVTLSQWDALVQATRAHIAYILEAEGGDEIIYLGERNAENPFLCYGREGEPCARCETPLTRQVLSNRPSFFCASCQPV